jgi:hypothetical protein
VAITNDPVTSYSQGGRLVPGDALAAVLGAGVGAFATGLVVLLNEMEMLTPPALYGPAGGVSGRTTLATIIWLAGWGVLHFRWRTRRLAPERIVRLALILIALGITAIFPPVWKLL